MTDYLNTTPYNLDWGNVTPDGYNPDKNEAIHVFNCDVSSKQNIDRVIVFTVGKLLWSGLHLSEGITQKVVFDLRGQPLALLDRAKEMKANIMNRIKSSSAGNINVLIEILI